MRRLYKRNEQKIKSSTMGKSIPRFIRGFIYVLICNCVETYNYIKGIIYLISNIHFSWCLLVYSIPGKIISIFFRFLGRCLWTSDETLQRSLDVSITAGKHICLMSVLKYAGRYLYKSLCNN